MSESALQKILGERRSVRRYAPRPVADGDILSLAEAARMAPSADNAQPCRFIAVRDPAARESLARASLSGIFSRTRFAAEAPLIVALCADRSGAPARAMKIKDKAMYQLDCGIAGEHLVLRAAELGLGTCWIGWFDRRAARAALGVPRGVEVVCLIAVGYPAKDLAPRPRRRKPLASLVWLDSWARPFPGADSYDEMAK
jgi:nitroreductase